jgi:hypothetical protein
MNAGNVLTAMGLVFLACFTMPFGLIILLGMAWMWKKS